MSWSDSGLIAGTDQTQDRSPEHSQAQPGPEVLTSEPDPKRCATRLAEFSEIPSGLCENSDRSNSASSAALSIDPVVRTLLAGFTQRGPASCAVPTPEFSDTKLIDARPAMSSALTRRLQQDECGQRRNLQADLPQKPFSHASPESLRSWLCGLRSPICCVAFASHEKRPCSRVQPESNSSNRLKGSVSKISVSTVGRCETGRLRFAFSDRVSPVSKTVSILQPEFEKLLGPSLVTHTAESAEVQGDLPFRSERSAKNLPRGHVPAVGPVDLWTRDCGETRDPSLPLRMTTHCHSERVCHSERFSEESPARPTFCCGRPVDL